MREQMNNHGKKYSYKTFRDDILPKFISDPKLVPMLKELESLLEQKLIQHSDTLYTKFGSAYCQKLLHIILPKMIRQEAHNYKKYVGDLWHIWMIATWEPKQLEQIQYDEQGGLFHWRLDWQDEQYGNTNSYTDAKDPDCY